MSQEFNEICRQLECWYAAPAGEYLYQQERRIVTDLLKPLHGPRLLQLGFSSGQSLIADAGQAQKIYASALASGEAELCSSFNQLPFAAESIDILVLHHAIEFTDNPHQLLREANRVLSHRGEIIVVGFNPWSLFGISRMLQRPLGKQPWLQAQLLSKYRLRDWLRLLGMEVESVRHSYTVPPLGRGRLREFLLGLDAYTTYHNWISGGLYVMHGRKHVAGITPDRARWNPRVRDQLIGLAGGKAVPSSRDGDTSA
jgi:SAM-dependent methyltransferase